MVLRETGQRAILDLLERLVLPVPQSRSTSLLEITLQVHRQSATVLP